MGCLIGSLQRYTYENIDNSLDRISKHGTAHEKLDGLTYVTPMG